MIEKYEYCSTVPRTFVQDCRYILKDMDMGQVVQSSVKMIQGWCQIWTQIWELKSIILFPYNLMSGYLKKNRENYQRECFW